MPSKGRAPPIHPHSEVPNYDITSPAHNLKNKQDINNPCRISLALCFRWKVRTSFRYAHQIYSSFALLLQTKSSRNVAIWPQLIPRRTQFLIKTTFLTKIF